MSGWSRFLKRMGALGAFIARVRAQIPKVAPLLDALQQDDHEGAWATFSAYGDVAEVLAKLSPEAQSHLPEIGPRVMEALDLYVDEDAIEQFLTGLGLLNQ